MLTLKKLSSKILTFGHIEPIQTNLQKNINSTQISYNADNIQSLSNAALQVKNFLSNCLVQVDPDDKKVYHIEEEMKKIKDRKEGMKGTIFDMNESQDESWSKRKSKGKEHQKTENPFQVIKLKKCSRKNATMIGDESLQKHLDRFTALNDNSKGIKIGYQRKESYSTKNPLLYSEILDKTVKEGEIYNQYNLKNNSEEQSLLNALLSPTRFRGKVRKTIRPSSKKSCALIKCPLDKDLYLENNEENKENSRNVNPMNNAKLKEFKEICTNLKDSIILSPDVLKKINEKPMVETKKYVNEDDLNSDEETVFKRRNQEIKEIKFRCLEKNKKYVYDSLSDEESDDEISGFVYFLPSSPTKLYFDAGIILLTIYSFIFTPYVIAFELFVVAQIVTWKNIMEYIIDVYFGLDLIIGFFTAYYDFEEQLTTRISLIAINYLKNWFSADFLCAIPFNFIIIYLNSRQTKITYTFVADVTKLIDLLRLIRLIKLFKVFFDNSCTSAIYKTVIGIDVLARKFRMLLSLFIFFLSVHLLSCIFIFLGQMEYPNWMSAQNIDINNKTKVYVTSLYYICATVFTIGYGDVLSVSTFERFFNLFLLVVGIMIYSWAVTSLSNYVQSVDSKTLDFQNKIAILEQIRVTHEKMPHLLYDKISRFLKYKLKNEKKDKNEIIDNLPISLRNSLIIEMYKPIINNFIFFKSFDNTDFIIQVILAFKAIQATKNEKLVNEGDYLEGIIFVKRGSLALEIPLPVVLRDDTLNSIQKKNSRFNLSQKCSLNKKQPDEIEYNEDENTLKKKKTFASLNKPIEQPRLQQQYIKIIEIRRNEHFGDILMFLNRRSPLTVKVKSKVAEIFLLKKTDAVEISMQFPRIWRKIIKKSLFNMEQIERLINKALRFFFIHNEGTKKKKKTWHYYHKDITKKNTLLSSQVLLNQLKNEELCELQSIPTSEENSEESMTEDLIGEEQEEDDDVILETDREDEDDSKYETNNNNKSIKEGESNNNEESAKRSMSSQIIQSISLNPKPEYDDNTVCADSILMKKEMVSLIDSSSLGQNSRKKDKQSNSSQLNTMPFSQDEINQENYPDENSINLIQDSLIPSIMPKESSGISAAWSNNNENFVHFFNSEKSQELKPHLKCNQSSLVGKQNEYNINNYFPVNQQFVDIRISHPISFTLKKVVAIVNKKNEKMKANNFQKSKSLFPPITRIESPMNQKIHNDEFSVGDETNQKQALPSQKESFVQERNETITKTMTIDQIPTNSLSMPYMIPSQGTNPKQPKKVPTVAISSNMLDVISKNIERNSMMLNNPKTFYSKYFSQVKVKEEVKDSNKVISKKLLEIVKLIENNNPEKGKIINSNVG